MYLKQWQRYCLLLPWNPVRECCFSTAGNQFQSLWFLIAIPILWVLVSSSRHVEFSIGFKSKQNSKSITNTSPTHQQGKYSSKCLSEVSGNIWSTSELFSGSSVVTFSPFLSLKCEQNWVFIQICSACLKNSDKWSILTWSCKCLNQAPEPALIFVWI